MALTPVRSKGPSPQRPRPMSRNQRVADSNLNSNNQLQSPKFGSEKGGKGNGTTVGENNQIDTHPIGNGRAGLLRNSADSSDASQENGSPRRVGPSENGAKLEHGPSLELPNQPTPLTPVVVEPPGAQTSQLDPTAAASVRWKATISTVVDKPDQAARIASPNGELILSVERNDSSLTNNSRGGGSGAGDSPRNLLSAAGSHAGEEVPTNRKLSLGDFVTDTVRQDPDSPVKWDTLETKNGLVNSLPYVPVSLAYVCLLMNVIIPGSGTILAAISMMCCGEPRGQTKPDELFHQFTTNIFVGVSQFFTVTFFLAGWIWSISWGVYLVLFAEENRLMKAEEEKRRKTAAIANTLWDR